MTNIIQTREKVICNQDTDAEKNTIKNNDTLLISEILGKVILPYTGAEIKKILEDEKNNYSSSKEVIEDKFTRNLSDYKVQFKARYNETLKLVIERDKYKKLDAIPLALEMMRKKYLNPAIITACRNLDELDVYLDCLEKNELDDFKIFKVKYELYPTIAEKEKDILKRTSIIGQIYEFIKKFFIKNTKKGKRYI